MAVKEGRGRLMLALLAKPLGKWVFAGIGVALMLSLLWGYGKYAERVGRLKCELAHEEAAQKLADETREREISLIRQLRAAQDKETIIYKTKVKTIFKEAENDECLNNARMPDTYLRDFGWVPDDESSSSPD